MKLNKIVLFLIIISALGGGLYFFQKDKQNKALIVHNQQKFHKIKLTAKKSGSAGLLVMVSAINKYHKVKGQYPKDLIELHPEFIPDKSFILSLNWKYNEGNGTFLVKRNIEGGRLFSMGPDMRLKSNMEEPTTSPQKNVSVIKPKSPEKITVVIASKSGPDIKSRAVQGRIKSNVSKKVTKFKPEITIVKKELSNDEKFLLSIDSSKFYIWKTNSGIIGFSNIKYPDRKNLTIFKNKSWIEYQENTNPEK